MPGFIQLNKCEETNVLLKDHPNEYLLLSLIALRTKRTTIPSPGGLQIGQALIGDYKSCGLTNQKYRTALKNLEKWQFLTTKPTNKGNVVTLLDSSVFNINMESANEQANEQLTNSQRTANKQLTTNKNDKNVKNDKNKEKDMFRTTIENVVQEPTNGRLKKFSDFDWSKDLLEIIGKYPTLKLVTSDDIKNIEFWDGHVDIMSEYFPTDSEMKRWFNRIMFEINRWQTDRPHKTSRSAKGLRQRISTWLSKEYQKLEVTKR